MDPPIDPRTGKPTDIWGGGTSLLADGRVLVTSDNLDEDPAHVSTGLNTVFTFDPWTESWQSHEPMRQGRWYPTQLLMPHGRTLIASGQSAPGDPDFGSLGPAGSRGMDDDAKVFEPGGDVSQLDFRSTSRSGRRSRRSTRGSFARIPGTCWLPARDRQLVPRSRQVVGVERAARPLAHARLGHCGHARRRARADSLRRVPRFPSDDTRIDVLGYSFGGFIAR